MAQDALSEVGVYYGDARINPEDVYLARQAKEQAAKAEEKKQFNEKLNEAAKIKVGGFPNWRIELQKKKAEWITAQQEYYSKYGAGVPDMKNEKQRDAWIKINEMGTDFIMRNDFLTKMSQDMEGELKKVLSGQTQYTEESKNNILSVYNGDPNEVYNRFQKEQLPTAEIQYNIAKEIQKLASGIGEKVQTRLINIKGISGVDAMKQQEKSVTEESINATVDNVFEDASLLSKQMRQPYIKDANGDIELAKQKFKSKLIDMLPSEVKATTIKDVVSEFSAKKQIDINYGGATDKRGTIVKDKNSVGISFKEGDNKKLTIDGIDWIINGFKMDDNNNNIKVVVSRKEKIGSIENPVTDLLDYNAIKTQVIAEFHGFDVQQYIKDPQNYIKNNPELKQHWDFKPELKQHWDFKEAENQKTIKKETPTEKMLRMKKEANANK